MASSTSRRLSSSIVWPISSRRRGNTGIAITGCLRQSQAQVAVTVLAIGNIGKRREPGGGGYAGNAHATGCCDTRAKPHSHDTSRIAWTKLMARVGEKFSLECPGCGGDIRCRVDGRQDGHTPAHWIKTLGNPLAAARAESNAEPEAEDAALEIAAEWL